MMMYNIASILSRVLLLQTPCQIPTCVMETLAEKTIFFSLLLSRGPFHKLSSEINQGKLLLKVSSDLPKRLRFACFQKTFEYKLFSVKRKSAGKSNT